MADGQSECAIKGLGGTKGWLAPFAFFFAFSLLRGFCCAKIKQTSRGHEKGFIFLFFFLFWNVSEKVLESQRRRRRTWFVCRARTHACARAIHMYVCARAQTGNSRSSMKSQQKTHCLRMVHEDTSWLMCTHTHTHCSRAGKVTQTGGSFECVHVCVYACACACVCTVCSRLFKLKIKRGCNHFNI